MPVQCSLLYAVSGKYLPIFVERNPSLMLSVKSNAPNIDLLHDFANIFFFLLYNFKNIGNAWSKLMSAFLLENLYFLSAKIVKYWNCLFSISSCKPVTTKSAFVPE